MTNLEKKREVLERLVLNDGTRIAGSPEKIARIQDEARDYIESIGIKEHSSYVNPEDMNSDFGFNEERTTLGKVLESDYSPVLLSPKGSEEVYALVGLEDQNPRRVLISGGPTDYESVALKEETVLAYKTPVDLTLRADMEMDMYKYFENDGRRDLVKTFHNKKAFERDTKLTNPSKFVSKPNTQKKLLKGGRRNGY